MNWSKFLVIIMIGSFLASIVMGFHVVIQDDLGEVNPRYKTITMIALFAIAVLSGALAAGLVR